MSIKKLTLFPLAMLITVSIDSIRNLPATALFGNSLLFFFIGAAICFLLPTALISTELAYAYPEKGGIYQWVKMGLGNHLGFIAIWLQWINTLVWYPTILSFIAGTAIYLINPALANNKTFLISAILVVFWGLTLLNLRGIKTSATFASLCSVVGMITPMLIIIALAAFWVMKGFPLQLSMTGHSLIPNLHHGQSWISLTAIITAFLGMELASVHLKNTKDPHKTFPKAIAISVTIITVTMLLGSLAIAWVIPANKILLVDGVMQTFELFFNTYHLHWMIPVITVMLVMGSLGGMINWMISPTKGLLEAAEDGYLPAFLKKQNQHGVESTILFIQAIIVTFICGAFYLIPSVNGTYWLLTDLSTEIYLIMYILLFITAGILGITSPQLKKTQFIPGKKIGFYITVILGLTGCLTTFIVGFIPPDNIDVGSHYIALFSMGLIAMIIPTLFFIYKKR